MQDARRPRASSYAPLPGLLRVAAVQEERLLRPSSEAPLAATFPDPLATDLRRPPSSPGRCRESPALLKKCKAVSCCLFESSSCEKRKLYRQSPEQKHACASSSAASSEEVGVTIHPLAVCHDWFLHWSSEATKEW
eukprot:CAMPEP_0183330994 /NCGR_PEP_ID=MMETSP0164_2-20130417/413_1 /TAXON_ID=221442 /ORGANISM="Coccolithus pelagicus ssp braarudi, Strain PLY182g" /LENGTH=135 /DNA_ID=CAMNT_0025499347 /DNA_START=198 /DNA_END=602 /DNA_ORIENTATION=+